MVKDYIFIGIILVLCVSVEVSSGETIPPSGNQCRPENRVNKETACLQHILDLLFDQDHFFFGRNLDKTCDSAARNNSEDINCFVDDGNTRRYSLASRLFNDNIRAETIDRYLTVTFSTLPGRYKACGAEGLPIEQRTTDVNPDMDPTTPVYVRNMPKFEMRSLEKDAYYTILVMDATFGFVHGLFLDYPTTRDVIPFMPPLNYRNITNTFVFLVYRQSERDYMLEPRTLGVMKNPSLNKHFKLNEFVTEHGLVGPKAVNWMTVNSDPWAVQQVADRFNEDFCIIFVMEAFRKMNPTFLPVDISTIDTALNVSFATSADNFFVCCEKHSTSSSVVTLNAIGNQILDNELLRIEPSITPQSTNLRPYSAIRQYTMIVLNSDMPDTQLASPAKPFIIFLATDIPEDKLSQSRSILPYKLPAMSPSASPQKIFFLLFEQNVGSNIDRGTLNHFTSTYDCPAEFAGRCRFNVSQFAKENLLILRGVNWVTVESGAMTRWNAVRMGGKEADVCRNQPGYSATCPIGKSSLDGVKSTGLTLVANLCSLLAFIIFFLI